MYNNKIILIIKSNVITKCQWILDIMSNMDKLIQISVKCWTQDRQNKGSKCNDAMSEYVILK